MRKYCTARIGVTALLIAGAGTAAASGSAVADPSSGAGPQSSGAAAPEAKASFCGGVAGIYGVSGTRSYKGRNAELWTEKLEDERARAYVEDITVGDRVEIQRSYKKFKMTDKPQHPSTGEVGSYGRCRNTASWHEAYIGDWMATDGVQLQIPGTGRSYAVRTCVFPDEGGKGCTKWFVDHN
ncbi:hypothetical protein DSC45_30530 [Streptomyces sp. YIM 130001]|uniref:hypothetical protein n=1 Tax=Streptomyces sp. YIM 130001 TaxID=2259644 RepID=UPI000E649696|nr:hypothetical protein [Streptomyces sp. YIM 130001]RII09417.1 hypothetical protein DSC45_30530 [Streptomyces sp. YIM 130001]